MLWVSLALAQAPGAEAYVEVVPVAQASGGLLSASEAWLQTEAADPLRLSLTGWIGAVSCTDFDHDDEGAAVRRWPSVESASGAPMRVVLDDERAVWREIFQLRAGPVQSSYVQWDCSPASLKALRDEGSRAVGDEALADWLADEHDVRADGQHCSHEECVKLGTHSPGFSRSYGGSFTMDNAGERDCRVACPVTDSQRQIDAANAQFEGRLYAHPSGESRALFATQALCEASELTNPYPSG